MIYGAKFEGVWLCGTAMVRAKNKAEAAKLLNAKLIDDGLHQQSPLTEDDIVVVKRGSPVLILDNGDY